MEMLQALYLAFYNPAFYQNVVKNGKGWGLHYLVLIVFIYNVCAGLNWYLGTSKFLSSSMSMGIIHQMPNFKLEHMKLSIDKVSPHTIFLPETKKILIIFDINHKFKSCAEAGSPFLITDSAVYQKNRIEPLFTYDQLPYLFPNTKNNISGTPQDVLTFMQQWLPLITLCYFVVFFFYELIGIICFNLFLAWVFGLFGSKHSFASRMRLLNVSRTPATLVSSILYLGSFPSEPIQRLIEGALVLLYIFLAFKWSRSTQEIA